jgi:HlyD family secretion protein
VTLGQRRLAFWGGIAAVLAAALAYAFRPQAVPVDLALVTRGPLMVTIDEEGETRVRDVFVLSAPVAGRAHRIEVEAGDTVVAGETTVAQIEPVDPALLDVRSEREARAELSAAAAARQLAAADLQRAQAELDFARSELARQKQLGQHGVASERDLDQAEKSFRTALAALETARASMQERSFQYDRARARLTPARPRGETQQGCDCIPVHAPVSGVVLRVLHESEGVVSAGTPLLEIGDPKDLEIVVNLLSADAVRVDPGDEVLIEQWGGGELLHGRVRRVEPYGFTKVSALGIEEQRVNALVDLTDPPARWQRLGHGYRVEARIVLWRGEDVVKLPLSALFRAGAPDRPDAGWAVFALERGRARLRPVTRGRHNDLEVEISAGLERGERVVLHPSDRVVDGVRITARR